MSGPSDAQKQVEEFDRLLKAQDVGATKRLVDSYQGVSAQLVRDTEALTKIAQTQGLKPWQVMRMQRYRELQAQYIQNFDRYAEAAGGVISDHQREAVNLARRGSEATVIAGLPPGITMDNMTNMGLGWNRLPDEAYRNFIGISANGAPVAELLRPLGPDAAMGIRQAIGNGIALGYGPRKVARQVADKSGMALSRSLLISRTEITRAHREASRLDYQNNRQLVKGYRRVATKSDRTCVACIALDGTKYALEEPLNEHPNGRCSMVPDVLDYADLGLDVERLPEPPTARDWLENQPEIVQRKILKKARFDAWKKGDIQLNQLATVRTNTVWGDSAVVKPLGDLGIAKPPPRPPKPPRLPKGAATKPTRRAAPKPPPEVEGDLVDPKFGGKVRGTKTTPPEPQLPEGFNDIPGDPIDPDDYLDIAPADADHWDALLPESGKRGIADQVMEQQRWARAVGGAVEANYTGLSIKAAREVNMALEATVVRNGWRPLNLITTERLPGKGGEFGRAFAYQSGNSVHINTQSSAYFSMRPGSVRGWDKKILADNEHIAAQYLEKKARLDRLEKEVIEEAEKRTIGTARATEDLKRMRDRLALHKKEGTSPFARWSGGDYGQGQRIYEPVPTLKEYLRRREGFASEADFIAARQQRYLDNLKDAVKKAKTEAAKKQSQVYHPTQGTETLKEIVTHEIGHYGHRRWGFSYRNEVLKGKKGKENARNLSEYALDSPEEHFAEAFAQAIHGDRSKLSADVLKFVDDVIDANTMMPEFENYLGMRYDKAKGGLP